MLRAASALPSRCAAFRCCAAGSSITRLYSAFRDRNKRAGIAALRHGPSYFALRDEFFLDFTRLAPRTGVRREADDYRLIAHLRLTRFRRVCD